MLGDTALPNMGALDAALFAQPDLQLRIWFNDGANGFAVLEPAQNLTPTPYAIVAGNLSGVLPVSQLSGTLSSGQLGGTYSGAVTFNNTGNVFSGNGSGLTGVNAAMVGGVSGANIWKLSGNSGVGSGQFLGTTDNQPLELRVNGQRALRLEPSSTDAPNIIAGSPVNYVSNNVVGATIAGGGTTNYSGYSLTNSVTADYGAVGGGLGNTASGWASTVGGGFQNKARGTYATVGGGFANTPSGEGSVVAGGSGNTASGGASIVAGGSDNTASGRDSTVAGGGSNTASGYASTVAGGYNNFAIGDFSFAGGLHAKALGNGSFVWSDANPDNFGYSGDNKFQVRASGGVWFYANAAASVGVYLPPGGNAWAATSDRNAKENFHAVDPQEILTKVAALPVLDYNLKSQDPSIRHLGPMAQDFYAAFGLGEDDKHITSVDADGVALAAIQGLNQKLETEATALRTENAQLKARLERLERLLLAQTSGGAK